MKKNSKSVQSDESASVGRPASKVVWPQGRFTVSQAFAANPHIKCKLTIINHMEKDLEGSDSKLVQLEERGKNPSGKGRPPYLYLRRSQQEAGNRLKAKADAKKASIVSPSVDMTPAPAVETPAETPAETAQIETTVNS